MDVQDPEKNGDGAQYANDISNGHHGLAIDPEIEKQVVRKLDWNLVPLVSSLYLLSFLDRSNIGNAKTAGMAKDLKLDSGLYDWLLTIFYITYICFGFSILCWKIFPPHRWAGMWHSNLCPHYRLSCLTILAFVVFGWGAVASCQSATTSWAGMMVCRALMGMFEIAFGPGVPYLLSFFYLRHELGFRSGIFLACAPLAT